MKNAQLLTRNSTKYGWRPDLPDIRDLMFSPQAQLASLPARVDLRPSCPLVYDQGQLGSCTANAIAAALEFDQMKQSLPQIFPPSRLFIYYNEREMEGTIGQDSGAIIRDGIKSVATLGAPDERIWPYRITHFAQRPPQSAYDEARKHPAVKYQRVSANTSLIRAALAAGFPVVFGFTVYDSFEGDTVARTGVLGMPGPGEKALGGHAVLAVGYDDASARFIVRNSWGRSWGQDGYFTMPYAYLSSRRLSSDRWTVEAVL